MSKGLKLGTNSTHFINNIFKEYYLYNNIIYLSNIVITYFTHSQLKVWLLTSDFIIYSFNYSAYCYVKFFIRWTVTTIFVVS